MIQQIQVTNNLLNFTPPAFEFLVGGINFSAFLTSLSISRPLAEINTPQSWSGSAELASPMIYSLLPESLDDLVNPGRWFRGVQVRLKFKNITFATLRILEYWYDEENQTATIQLGDILSLLDDEVPAKDYKGLGFTPCQSVSLSVLATKALQEAGFSCISVNIPGTIEVPPNKPNGSWVSWVQTYLGERGYWLYVRPDECIAAAAYPLGFAPITLFALSKFAMEHFQRDRSPELPADKYIVSGSVEKFADCGSDEDQTIREDFVVLNTGGSDINALQRREIRTIRQRVNFQASVQTGMPIYIQSSYATVQIVDIVVSSALGAIFPETYPGSTQIIVTERGTEYKAYDSQGRLRAKYFQNSRLLGQVVPDAFPGDRTMVDSADRILEEFLENLPGVSKNDGVLRRREYTYRSLFAEGTEATEWEGAGRIVFGGISYSRAIKERTIEEWRDNNKITDCSCDRYEYSQRVWVREQVQISALEAQPFNTGQYYTEDVPFYRMGSLQIQSELSENNSDSVPPAWETAEPTCPTCEKTIKNEAFFVTASISPFRQKEKYFTSQTLESDTEAQQLARLLGTIQTQRYRARKINSPLHPAFLINSTPFGQAYCHNGAFVMDAPSINLATDGLEMAFTGNYIGGITPVEELPSIQVQVAS